MAFAFVNIEFTPNILRSLALYLLSIDLLPDIHIYKPKATFSHRFTL